ncbi:hypothetical protein [Methylobacterium oryzae]|uniref:hypothetical protein n=1 Tax=Methylobacterium oryzae TaxID=334852 RepID=UPI002F35A979
MSSHPPGSVTVRGSALIGAAEVTAAEVFRAVDPAAGAALEPAISAAGPAEVAAADVAEVTRSLDPLGGQFTATLHLGRADEHPAAGPVPLRVHEAGRILANGWPTGMKVAPAPVHGGPLPATSDDRSSSAGTPATERFPHPARYRDLPDARLPPLRPANPLRPARRIDGVLAPQPGR